MNANASGPGTTAVSDAMQPAACAAMPVAAPYSPPLQGCRQDHRELLAGYWGEVRRFVASRVVDSHDADDITQQTLQQAIRSLDSFRGGNLRAWLFCIGRHAIAARARTRAREQFVEFDENDPQHGEQPQTAADVVQVCCDARERIHRCLDCMENGLRMAEEVAVLLSDVHGCADHESATRLRMTLASFKFLLHRARTRLHAMAANENPPRQCPLVSKTGARVACSVRLPEDGGTRRCAGDARPSGLDGEDLAALRRELVDALGVGCRPFGGAGGTVEVAVRRLHNPKGKPVGNWGFA